MFKGVGHYLRVTFIEASIVYEKHVFYNCLKVGNQVFYNALQGYHTLLKTSFYYSQEDLVKKEMTTACNMCTWSEAFNQLTNLFTTYLTLDMPYMALINSNTSGLACSRSFIRSFMATTRRRKINEVRCLN